MTNEIPYHPPYTFQWGAVIAGAFFAMAVSVILFQFGSVLGLSLTDSFSGEVDLTAKSVVAAGLWLLWVQLLASLGGGYIAGRLRAVNTLATSHENELRDGIAGMMSWAVSTVLMFIGASIAAAFASYIAAVTNPDVGNEVLTDSEHNAMIIFAFIAGATSLLSAAAAWWTGTVGGDHRDSNMDLSGYISFRKR